MFFVLCGRWHAGLQSDVFERKVVGSTESEFVRQVVVLRNLALLSSNYPENPVKEQCVPSRK